MRYPIYALLLVLLLSSPASARQDDGEAATTDLARENYRQILELSEDDPALHVEVLRRLGDLELDAAEASQLDENIESIDLTAFDNAVSLYRQLLETYPARGGCR